MQLDAALHDIVEAYCVQGDEHFEREEYEPALEAYETAWDLLPEPKVRWDIATWIMVAIGDTCHMLDDFEGSAQAYRDAQSCPGGKDNPLLHLRLGQVAYDQDAFDVAGDELLLAYRGAGEKVFKDEDPIYLEFLKRMRGI
ncbi:hypothetical protein [Bordetella genomosp. 5]|uniref:Uncharacterized protein n=1 Tax=Bordetella genomosp. 5 TaxID=1395608 RepID=A0A261TIF5_9BORD|nr:hypothetical protein [Bordetella genomosp. 5]OZI49007.1 hypothetical protein CAL25_15400 [Bordetella genomosp. 5]